jgi:hypothetical protein
MPRISPEVKPALTGSGWRKVVHTGCFCMISVQKLLGPFFALKTHEICLNWFTVFSISIHHIHFTRVPLGTIFLDCTVCLHF